MTNSGTYTYADRSEEQKSKFVPLPHVNAVLAARGCHQFFATVVSTSLIFGGSMHYANIGSKAVRPGDGSVWTLCVKHGRDSR